MPIAAPEALGKKTVRFKMALVNNEFLEEYGGWCPAGSVLIVDEDTAERWYERGIAKPAATTDKTVREIKRDQNLKRLQAAAVDDDEDAPVSIGKQPVGRTTRRAVKHAKPDLAGAGVINSFADSPDDDAIGGDAEDDED